MAVIGVAVVRDEADVVVRVVQNMLDQVDEVIVADNGSVDGTRDLLADLPIEVIDDPDQRHYQSRKMTRLAERAASRGATWVVPFDADEMWHAATGRIAERLVELPRQVEVAVASILDYRPTTLDPDERDPVLRITWRHSEPEPAVKVACRVRPGMVIGDGNHKVTYPRPSGRLRRRLARPPADPATGLLVVRHFPYRSPQQFVSKVRNGSAALRATVLRENVGAHWRMWGELLEQGGEEALERCFARDHLLSDPEAAGFVHDPAVPAVAAALGA